MPRFRYYRSDPKHWEKTERGLQQLQKESYWAKYVFDLEDIGNKTLEYIKHFFDNKKGSTRLVLRDRKVTREKRDYKIMGGFNISFLNFRPRSGKPSVTNVLGGPKVGFTIFHREENVNEKIRARLRIMDEGYAAPWIAFSRVGRRMWIPVEADNERGYNLIPVDTVEHQKGEGATHYMTWARDHMKLLWAQKKAQASTKYWDAIDKHIIE